MAATNKPDSSNQPSPESYGGMAPGSSNARAVRHPDTGTADTTDTRSAPQSRQTEPPASGETAAAAADEPPAAPRKRARRPVAATKKRK